MSTNQEKMNALVNDFVNNVTELAIDMARDALLAELTVPKKSKPNEFSDPQVQESLTKSHSLALAHDAKKRKKNGKAKQKKQKKQVAKPKAPKKSKAKTNGDLHKRQSDAKRAWYLRKKQKDGHPIKDEDAAWLRSYEEKNPPKEAQA